MIFAGTLTEQLDFYHIIETQSSTGFKNTEEVLFWSCKAYRIKNKENYAVDANELFHTNELRFVLRYCKEIKETDIVIYEGEKYRITSINKYPRDREETIIVARINE